MSGFYVKAKVWVGVLLPLQSLLNILAQPETQMIMVQVSWVGHIGFDNNLFNGIQQDKEINSLHLLS